MTGEHRSVAQNLHSSAKKFIVLAFHSCSFLDLVLPPLKLPKKIETEEERLLP